MLETNNLPSYLLAADSHNLGNSGDSWYDPSTWGTKFGNFGKLAVTSVLSGANSFYNTAVTVGNWFGADLQENNTQQWISTLDSDLGAYYRQNQETADLGGLVLGSLIPGLGGIKILNAGQKVLKAGVESGKIGGNLARATGLLVPSTEKYIGLAAQQIQSSQQAFKLLNINTAKAVGAGLWQNTLEAAAFETVVQSTMFKNPILEHQDIGDIFTNIAVGGALGGVISGAFSGAKILGQVKKLEAAESAERFPFISRPSFTQSTSPSERIIQLAHDNEAAAVPVKLIDAEGNLVQNNYTVNKSLFDQKIQKNNNEIRDNIHQLTSGDVELGNIVANGVYKGTPDEFMKNYSGSAQQFFENFSGAERISRISKITDIEQAAKRAGAQDTLATRYIGVLGESEGQTFAELPKVLSLGDKFAGKEKILSHVRSYGFSVAKQWEPMALKAGTNLAQESEARYIWAHYQIKGIKDDSLIHINDIPLLERAYMDNQLNIRILEGSGPTAETIIPQTRDELWQVIKESKSAVAEQLMNKKVSTEEISKIVNAKQSYLEGTAGVSEFDDLLAFQSDKSKYLQSLKDKGLPTAGAAEATDPIFLPKLAKIVYSVDKNVQDTTPAIADAIALYKTQQKLYQENNKIVVSRILGPKADSLPDITDTALAGANRNGSGAGLFSSENSNYGTLGSAMAWIGSVTRDAKQAARKAVGEALETPLINLGKDVEAAIEFEGINQKITRSAKLWKLDEDNRALVSVEKAGIDPEYIHIDKDATLEFLRAHIQTTGERVQQMKELRAAQGYQDEKLTDVFRPIRPDLKAYPHFAFVRDPQVTGTGHMTMIHAATEKELSALMDRVPSRYEVLTKSDVEDFKKARQEYEYSRTLHENYIDQDLANRGVMSNFFPKSDPQKIVNDILQQHYRESDVLTSEAVRLRYEAQFGLLEDLGRSYSNVQTSKFASSREMIENTSDNPYFNYIKTALDISKISEHPLIYGFNKLLDGAVSKFSGALKDSWDKDIKSPADLDKLNAVLDKYGIKPAYYDSALHVLANHEAPKGVLTKFVRNANSLMSLFTLGLDPLNALNNSIGANILRFTELRHLTQAIEAGNKEVSGALADIAKIALPGTGDQTLAPTKLVARAIENFWRDDGTLIAKYKADGYIKDRVEQLKLLVDDFTLKGTETAAELQTRTSTGFQRAKDLAKAGETLSGNKLAEEFNRFISANVMDQITGIGLAHGLLDPAAAKSYINTFVNRVEGNIIASQRPLIFQGPIGQAISLFQSYQFNLLQQLFRYTAEGSGKDLGMLFGLQSTLYGVQSLPAFQFINTHIVGQLSGNVEHRDAYDAVYGAAGKTAGDWMLYGLPSNLLKSNIYSRGDINPRQITLLPTNLQEIPIVQGWGKFFLNLKDTVSKVAGGGNIWESVLQGVEHNGISRPLAGMAQVFQGLDGGTVYSTTNKGSILYSNDLYSWSSVVRLAGGRPLDEAVTNDALFRVKSYEAARRKDMEQLNETVKSALVSNGQPSQDQLNQFINKYVELGGKQAQFNKWMMGLYKNANVSQAQQLEMNLKNPFSYKIQLLMGGTDD